MKFTAIRTVLVATMFSACMFAHAQSSGRSMTATIPFGFEAAGKSLPAGHYVVTQADGGHLLSVRQSSGGHGVMMATYPDQYIKASEHSSLVFLHTGQNYRLLQVRNGAAGQSYKVYQGKPHIATSQGIGRIQTIIADPQ